MRRKRKTQEQSEKKVLSDVIEKIKLSDDNLSKYQDRFTRFYKLYRNYIDKNKWATKTKIFIPLVYNIIEAQTARVVSTKPGGEWKPATEGAVGDPEKITKAFNDWWKRERLLLASQDMFKKTLLYGSAAAQIYWKYDLGYKMGQSFVKASRPAIRVLRMEDLYYGFDPEATSFKECKWAFVRYSITKKELEDIKKSPSADLYINLDKAIDDFTDDDGYEKNAYMDERLGTIDASFVKDTTTKKAECVYLENYATGDCVTVVGKKHIIMNQKNPYLLDRQLMMTHNIRVPGEIVGMSEAEPVEKIAHGVNLFTNQRADVIDSLLHPKWVVGDDGDIDDNEIIEEDSLIVHTSDINQVKPMPKDNLTPAAFKEDEALKNDVYAASSVTPFSLGDDSTVKSDRSGKAIAHLQSAADARIKSKMMNFEVDFIKEVAEKWQRLMAQYQTEPLVINDGDEQITIMPEDLGYSEDGNYGEWEFHVETGSTGHVSEVENRENIIAYQQKLIELAGLKAQQQVPQGQPQMDEMGQPMPMQETPQTIDYDAMAEKLSEVFNVKDWREMWTMADEEEVPQEQVGEMLPGLEDEQMQQGGEMLPNINDEAQGQMLPSIDDDMQQQGNMLPEIDDGIIDERQDPTLDTQNLLPEIDAPVKEEKKKGLIGKLKDFLISKLKGKKKEQLPKI